MFTSKFGSILKRFNSKNLLLKVIRKFSCSSYFYLRSWITAQPEDLCKILKSDSVKQVLCVIAHPDDETFCSGLIVASINLGSEVSILCMTRGEGGDRETFTKEQIGAVREVELRNAAEVLNVKNLWFMDYEDPEPQNSKLVAPEHDSNTLTRELAQKISQSRADIVVTHGSIGEYYHPAHILLNLHVRKALKELGNDRITLLTMNAWNPSHLMQNIINKYDYPSHQLDGSAFHDKRLQTLECYRTQQRAFEKFCGGSLDRFIRLSAVERYCLVTTKGV